MSAPVDLLAFLSPAAALLWLFAGVLGFLGDSDRFSPLVPPAAAFFGVDPGISCRVWTLSGSSGRKKSGVKALNRSS